MDCVNGKNYGTSTKTQHDRGGQEHDAGGGHIQSDHPTS